MWLEMQNEVVKPMAVKTSISLKLKYFVEINSYEEALQQSSMKLLSCFSINLPVELVFYFSRTPLAPL